MLLQAYVKSDPNKVAGGVLPDIVHRLYQDISVLSECTLSWYTLKNVISFKPMRRVWPSLQKVYGTASAEQHYVQILYTEFDPNGT